MMRLARLFVTLALMAALFWLTDPRAIFARLGTADLGWLAVAFLSLTAATGLMAWRWQKVAAYHGLPLDYRRALSEYYLAQVVNNVVPGGVAGDVARAVRLRHAGNLSLAAQSVAQERLIGQIVLLLLLSLALTIGLITPGGLPWPGWAWACPAAAVVMLVVGTTVSRTDTRPGRFLATTRRLGQNPSIMLISIGISALLIAAFDAAARATGTILPGEALLILPALILTAMLIPLSIGGWGWREGAAAALFPLAAASPEAGLAASIVYGAVAMVAALPALFLLPALKPEISR